MKYDCEIVQDLIPLVLDGIASEKSVTLVKEHMQECVTCSRFYKSMSHNIPIDTAVDMSEETLYEKERVATYGKLIKKRRIMTIVAVILGIAGLLIVQAGIILGSVGAISFFGKEYKTTDPAQYSNYTGHISNEASGMFSDLLVFPSDLPGSARIEDYYYYCSDKGLDSSYQIILEYALSPEDFQKEKQRLSALSVTYKDKTNNVLYDTTAFHYPAYVTVFHDNETYEYALLDAANNRIICIFSQFQDLDESPLNADYLPSGTSVSGISEYSMYYFPSIPDQGTRVKPQQDY